MDADDWDFFASCDQEADYADDLAAECLGGLEPEEEFLAGSCEDSACIAGGEPEEEVHAGSAELPLTPGGPRTSLCSSASRGSSTMGSPAHSSPEPWMPLRSRGSM